MSETALTEAVYYILLSLTLPRHGYAIMQAVQRMTAGRLDISAGTLYGALSSLVARGWIEELPAPADSRRREYRLTTAGHAALAAELTRLQELLDNGRAVLKGTDPS